MLLKENHPDLIAKLRALVELTSLIENFIQKKCGCYLVLQLSGQFCLGTKCLVGEINVTRAFKTHFSRLGLSEGLEI